MPSSTANCCRTCLSNAVIGTCASVYLIFGVAIASAAAATFFTPYGQILTPLYAGSMLGIGISIFAVGVVGLFAACDSKQRVCTLYVFGFLTLSMIVATAIVGALMFEYERILEVASGTGSEGGVQALSRSIDRASTAVVKTLATNAFYACGAMVNATLFSPAVYTFRCSDSAFSHLQDTINGTCTNGLNASVGAAYYHCYAGGAYLSWSAVDAFGHAVNLTASGTLASLNTPKGLFCACSSTVIDEYVLPYLRWAKWVVIALTNFLFFVLLACVHQLCERGCCGGRHGSQRVERNDLTPDANLSSIQTEMRTYPQMTQTKKAAAPGSHLSSAGEAIRQKYRAKGGEDGGDMVRP